MAKFKGIRKEQTFRGRYKGNTEGRVTNDKIVENWEEVKWNTPQLCEVCFYKPCRCGEGND